MALSRYEHTGDAPATGLASGIGSTDTTLTLVSGTGYPTGAVGKFVICIDAGTSSEEKILCSARSGTTVTVATSGRGYDNTTAASHSAGSTNVTHVLAAAEIDDASDHIYTTTRFDHDTQYLRRDGSTALTGVTSVAAAPGNSAVGDAAAKGSGPTLALSDHKHGREAFGSGVTAAVGNANADGTSTSLARADHVHAGAGTTDAAWTNATLTNSWVNATSQTTRYRLHNGMVVGEGQVSGGASGASAFTLPSGYRPGQALELAVTSGVGNGSYATLVIGTDGTVSPLGSSVNSGCSMTFSFFAA